MSRREQIEQLLAEDPDDVFLNYALAKEWHSEGAVPEALAAFDRVISLHPDYVPAYFQKGQVLVEDGEVESARAVLTDGIAVARRVGDEHAAEEMSEYRENLS